MAYYIHAVDTPLSVVCFDLQPCPGDYSIKGVGERTDVGSKIGKSSPKSELEWKIYRAKQVPGPGEYHIPSTLANTGGTFNNYAPKTDVEILMDRARKIPGPGNFVIVLPTCTHIRHVT